MAPGGNPADPVVESQRGSKPPHRRFKTDNFQGGIQILVKRRSSDWVRLGRLPAHASWSSAMTIALLTFDRFVASLDAVQRQFFVAREAELERRDVAGFGACCQALGLLSELQSQAAHERLARQG